MALVCASPPGAAAGDNVLQGLDPLTVPTGVLRTRIERETNKVVRALSPEGKNAVNRSLSRFLDWAGGYCQGDARCLRNQYFNYLAAIPDSVYRVGRWTVYTTGVYALEWADEDLQGMDPDRPFTWDLQLTWPRVDAQESPLQRQVPLSGLAYDALGVRVRKLMADWAEGGWSRSPVFMPPPSVRWSLPRAGEMPGSAAQRTARARSRSRTWSTSTRTGYSSQH